MTAVTILCGSRYGGGRCIGWLEYAAVLGLVWLSYLFWPAAPIYIGISALIVGGPWSCHRRWFMRDAGLKIMQ
jgi:hypothetical protein